MKKLLFGVIALLTLTITSHAACTTDVNMSGNKITSLGMGTSDGDAVNYEQVAKMTIADIPEDNASILASHSGTYNVQVEKKNGVCILRGLVQNKSASTITTMTNFGTIPVGYRPNWTIHHKSSGFNNANIGDSHGYGDVLVFTDGTLRLDIHRIDGGLVSNRYFGLNIVYMCN